MRKLSKAEQRETATCPNCGDHAANLKELDEKFGFRDVGSISGGMRTSKYVPQSRCRECRSNKKIDGVPVAVLRHRQRLESRIVAAEKIQRESRAALSPIPTDRETLRVMYQKHYPGDTNGSKRSVNFMTAKLTKKLGGK